jgi:hypothetical protein
VRYLLLLFILGGCILTDRRLQPVNPDSLAKDPNTRPDYWENQRYIDKEKMRKPEIPSYSEAQKGIQIREKNCSETHLDGGTIALRVHKKCIYENSIRLQIKCKKEMQGYSSASFPLRFKKVPLSVRYTVGDSERELVLSSQTGHNGEWSVEFTTKEPIRSVFIYTTDKREVFSGYAEPVIVLDEKECTKI